MYRVKLLVVIPFVLQIHMVHAGVMGVEILARSSGHFSSGSTGLRIIAGPESPIAHPPRIEVETPHTNIPLVIFSPAPPPVGSIDFIFDLPPPSVIGPPVQGVRNGSFATFINLPGLFMLGNGSNIINKPRLNTPDFNLPGGANQAESVIQIDGNLYLDYSVFSLDESLHLHEDARLFCE